MARISQPAGSRRFKRISDTGARSLKETGGGHPWLIGTAEGAVGIGSSQQGNAQRDSGSEGIGLFRRPEIHGSSGSAHTNARPHTAGPWPAVYVDGFPIADPASVKG